MFMLVLTAISALFAMLACGLPWIYFQVSLSGPETISGNLGLWRAAQAGISFSVDKYNTCAAYAQDVDDDFQSPRTADGIYDDDFDDDDDDYDGTSCSAWARVQVVRLTTIVTVFIFCWVFLIALLMKVMGRPPIRPATFKRLCSISFITAIFLGIVSLGIGASLLADFTTASVRWGGPGFGLSIVATIFSGILLGISYMV